MVPSWLCWTFPSTRPYGEMVLSGMSHQTAHWQQGWDGQRWEDDDEEDKEDEEIGYYEVCGSTVMYDLYV